MNKNNDKNDEFLLFQLYCFGILNLNEKNTNLLMNNEYERTRKLVSTC